MSAASGDPGEARIASPPGAAGSAAGRAPGRPSTGARERILEACLDVLKTDGYAGLTLAKVAARAGENKALVSYHFGSKQGAVAAAGRTLGELITADVLAGIRDAATTEEVVRGAVDGTWRVLDRDERIARVYFDLNAVSVVEDDVRSVMREIKSNWRRVLGRLLRDAADGPSGKAAAASAAVLITAGTEGLCLERIERGDTRELARAKQMFIEAATRQIVGT